MTEPAKAALPVRLDDLIDAIRKVHDDELEQLSDAVLAADSLGDLADHLIGHFVDQARRSGAIERLERLGLHGMARRAEEMVHVLAPRPGGLLVALDAAPEADVVLVAHTGLDHVVTLRELWRAIPIDKQITMKWWQVPRAEIPADRDARIDWLYGWWERIDDWVEQHRVVADGRPRDDERPGEDSPGRS